METSMARSHSFVDVKNVEHLVLETWLCGIKALFTFAGDLSLIPSILTATQKYLLLQAQGL